MKVLELLALAPAAQIFEMKKSSKYVVCIPKCPLERCADIMTYLKNHGLDAIVLAESDVRIFEIDELRDAPKLGTPGFANIQCDVCSKPAMFIVERNALCYTHREEFLAVKSERKKS